MDYTSFTSDARISLAQAITEAEKTENNGVLWIKRWRNNSISNVQVTLPVLGTYSSTAPYNCPKSTQILANAIVALRNEELDEDWSGPISALALLSAGDPADLPVIQSYARSLQPDADPTYRSLAFLTWHTAYRIIFLAEYYLSTSDAAVLPTLNAYLLSATRAQDLYGCFGHSGAIAKADGSYNGSVPWYGPINSAGLAANLGLVLGKKAIEASGSPVPATLDAAIDRASDFFSYYVGKGSIPYGQHAPYHSHESNGRNSIAAIMYALDGGKSAQAKFYSKMSLASYLSEETGHTGPGFSFLWTALGANAGGEAAGSAYLRELWWHRDLTRRSDGSFVYDAQSDGIGGSEPGAEAQYWTSLKYYGMSANAYNVLHYSLPLKNLFMALSNS